MIASPVIPLGVADRPDHGDLVGDGCQASHVLGEIDAGGLRGDRFELTANLGRGQRFGIESFVVRRAAIQPDQDAALRGHRQSGGASFGAPAQTTEDRSAQQAAEAELEKIPASHSRTVEIAAHGLFPATRVGLDRSSQHFNLQTQIRAY